MPRASHDDLPLVEIVVGYSNRLADWGGVTDAVERTMEAVRRNHAGEARGG